MTGAELREKRKAAGISIKKAAELSGTPYRTWQNWEAEGKESRRPPGIVFSWLQLYVRLQQTL
jgi:transcriptional regulator with XRE-family HTH domain